MEQPRKIPEKETNDEPPVTITKVNQINHLHYCLEKQLPEVQNPHVFSQANIPHDARSNANHLS
jgi:hypothetical protein